MLTYQKASSKSYTDYEIVLVGNPNVGKSTIFNSLTGLNQHTGNWSGKTVNYAYGSYIHNNRIIKVVDLPGSYSLNGYTDEEIIANEYISNSDSIMVVVLDSTNLLRNLNILIQVLNISNRVIACLNFSDELKKQNITIDTDELSLQLGIPVIKTTATDSSTSIKLKQAVDHLYSGKINTFCVNNLKVNNELNYSEYTKEIFKISENIYNKCVCSSNTDKNKINIFDRLLCKKITGIPMMILMLAVVFWITIFGANYLSEYLSSIFEYIKIDFKILMEVILINETIISLLVDGIFTTLSWVVSVMLPPMAIFFPIFSLLEDCGLLPRIAFNADGLFRKAGCNGQMSLTMAMGFGCNSCGVTGCRIIRSKKEKNIAIITNSFMPCNGKLPSLITIATIFFATSLNIAVNALITSFVLIISISLAIFVTILTSYVLSKTVYKSEESTFVMEIPPLRKPQIIKTIAYALRDKAWYVLKRAVVVAIPAGAIIWIFTNVYIENESLLCYIGDMLDPIGALLGLNGIVLLAFILGFPANEIVIPIIVMAYLSHNSLVEYTSIEHLAVLLQSNNWSIITGICFMIMCIFHFPCSTTCLTIYKETKNIKTTALAIIIPTLIGLFLCFIVNTLSLLVSFA